MALAQDGRLGATQNRGRPSVYLDHWALRNISQNPAWAEQFREGLHARGGSLAISLQNFVEFSQLTDRSQIATAEQFIDSLLPNIYFQDISYPAVIRAEKDQLQELRGEKERSRQR
jgi:hypothetical protein